MLNCHEATRLMSEAGERGLGLRERMSLGIHVMICSACRRFGVQMAALRSFMRAYAAGNDKDAS